MSKEELDTPRAVRLRAGQWDELRKLSAQHEMSMQEFIRQAVSEMLERKGINWRETKEGEPK